MINDVVSKRIQVASLSVGHWELVEVTPDMAKLFLGTSKGNRTVRRRMVNRYARQMAEGTWRTTHEGIAFDVDDCLIDGHHRCEAIVKSGVTVIVWVYRYHAAATVDAIDTGATRTTADAASFLGMEASKDDIALARCCMGSGEAFGTGGDCDYTHHEVLAWCNENQQKLETIRQMFRGKRTPTHIAAIRACCFRALTLHPSYLGRIKEFTECLGTGVVSCETDSAAGALYRFVMANKISVSGRNARREVYYKAASALVAFLEHRPLSKLYEAERDPFIAPE